LILFDHQTYSGQFFQKFFLQLSITSGNDDLGLGIPSFGSINGLTGTVIALFGDGAGIDYIDFRRLRKIDPLESAPLQLLGNRLGLILV
jgi:hypothetical protein